MSIPQNLTNERRSSNQLLQRIIWLKIVLLAVGPLSISAQTSIKAISTYKNGELLSRVKYNREGLVTDSTGQDTRVRYKRTRLKTVCLVKREDGYLSRTTRAYNSDGSIRKVSHRNSFDTDSTVRFEYWEDYKLRLSSRRLELMKNDQVVAALSYSIQSSAYNWTEEIQLNAHEVCNFNVFSTAIESFEQPIFIDLPGSAKPVGINFYNSLSDRLNNLPRQNTHSVLENHGILTSWTKLLIIRNKDGSYSASLEIPSSIDITNANPDSMVAYIGKPFWSDDEIVLAIPFPVIKKEIDKDGNPIGTVSYIDGQLYSINHVTYLGQGLARIESTYPNGSDPYANDFFRMRLIRHVYINNLDNVTYQDRGKFVEEKRDTFSSVGMAIIDNQSIVYHKLDTSVTDTNGRICRANYEMRIEKDSLISELYKIEIIDSLGTTRMTTGYGWWYATTYQGNQDTLDSSITEYTVDKNQITIQDLSNCKVGTDRLLKSLVDTVDATFIYGNESGKQKYKIIPVKSQRMKNEFIRIYGHPERLRSCSYYYQKWQFDAKGNWIKESHYLCDYKYAEAERIIHYYKN